MYGLSVYALCVVTAFSPQTVVIMSRDKDCHVIRTASGLLVHTALLAMPQCI